jgi:hypothetical protein
MSKSDLRRVAGMPPGYQSGGLVRAMTRPAGGGGASSSGDTARLQKEISRLRSDVQRLADRPVDVRVGRRASREIYDVGKDYDTEKNPRSR